MGDSLKGLAWSAYVILPALVGRWRLPWPERATVYLAIRGIAYNKPCRVICIRNARAIAVLPNHLGEPQNATKAE